MFSRDSRKVSGLEQGEQGELGGEQMKLAGGRREESLEVSIRTLASLLSDTGSHCRVLNVYFERERESKHKQGRRRERGRERESQAVSMLSMEPNTGLSPTTPGSRPEPKSRVRHLTEPPTCPHCSILRREVIGLNLYLKGSFKPLY